MLFKKNNLPMWENFVDGGAWIIKYNKKTNLKYLDNAWEKVLFACIGE